MAKKPVDIAAVFEKVLGRKFTPDDFQSAGLTENAEKPLPKYRPIQHRLNAEMALKHLQYPLTPKVERVCKICGLAFLASYEGINTCSDDCTRKACEKYGIKWIESRYRNVSEIDSWGGCVPPAIIPPDALSVMKYLVELAEKNQGFPVQPWQPPGPKKDGVSYSSPVPTEPASQSDTELLPEILEDIPKRPSLAELLKDLD